MLEYLAAFNIGKMLNEWKYCPICGNEILEVYPGDFVGHITCWDEKDECTSIGFGIIIKENGIYQSTHPLAPKVGIIDDDT